MLDAALSWARSRTSLPFGAIVVALVCGTSAFLVACRSETEDGAAAEVQRTLTALRGVPQDGITLGTPDASATLTAYVDVTTRTELLDPPVFAQVIRDFVRPGRLRIQLRTVPAGDEAIASDSGWAAARALQAAGVQDRLWDLYAVFDADYIGVLSDEDLRTMGRSVPGLDVPGMLREARSPRIRKAIERALAYAQAARITTTPAFVLQRTDGAPIVLRGSLVRGLQQNLGGV
jgi:protein-disulfide isomerase